MTKSTNPDQAELKTFRSIVLIFLDLTVGYWLLLIGNIPLPFPAVEWLLPPDHWISKGIEITFEFILLGGLALTLWVVYDQLKLRLPKYAWTASLLRLASTAVIGLIIVFFYLMILSGDPHDSLILTGVFERTGIRLPVWSLVFLACTWVAALNMYSPRYLLYGLIGLVYAVWITDLDLIWVSVFHELTGVTVLVFAILWLKRIVKEYPTGVVSRIELGKDRKMAVDQTPLKVPTQHGLLDGVLLFQSGSYVLFISLRSFFPFSRFYYYLGLIIIWVFFLGRLWKKIQDRLPKTPKQPRKKFSRLSLTGILGITVFYISFVALVVSGFHSAESWFSSTDWLVWFPSLSVSIMFFGIVLFWREVDHNARSPHYTLLAVLICIASPFYMIANILGVVPESFAAKSPEYLLVYFGVCMMVIGAFLLVKHWRVVPQDPEEQIDRNQSL